MVCFIHSKLLIMKKILWLLIYLIISNFCHAQWQTGDMSFQDRGLSLDVYDLSGNPVPVNSNYQIEGNPYLNNDWGTGSVILEDGKQYTNLPLQYNLLSGKLLVKKDSGVYTFSEDISTFKMTYKDSSKTKTVLFRAGYPHVRKDKTTKLLYEVITDGPNVQFVKFLRPYLDEIYHYGSAATKRISIIEELYLFDVKRQTLTQISYSKKVVQNALPDYYVEINKFNEKNDFTYTNDKEINLLITQLNYIK